MYLVPYRPQPRITHRHVPPHCVGGTIAPLSVFVGGSTIAPLSVCLWEEQTLSVCRCDVSVTVQCVCAHATTVTRVTTHHTTGLLLLRVVCDTSPLSLHYTPGIPTLASSRSNVEAIHQHDAPQIAQGEVVSCNYPPKSSLVNKLGGRVEGTWRSRYSGQRELSR